MNKKQLKNLKIGRDYLMNNVSDAQFDMEHYLYTKSTECELELNDQVSCDTIGCALGWMTQAPKLSKYNNDSYYFPEFAEKAFGIDDNVKNKDTFDFIFNSDYGYRNYDNTRLGAIGRIDVILKYPDLFKDNN